MVDGRCPLEMLSDQGVERGAIVEALRAEGFTLPVAPFPSPPDPWRRPQRLEVTHALLPAVLEVLKERFPPSSGLRWGFNESDAGAILMAEEGIDLEQILRDASENARQD